MGIMGDQFLEGTKMWEKLNRKVVRTDKPTVTVRRDGLALNKAAALFMGVSGAPGHVEVFFDRQSPKVGLQLVDGKTDDSYLVKADGGGSKKNGATLHIACGAALFAAMPSLSRGDKMELMYDDGAGFYFFRVGLSFDRKLSDGPPDAGGIGVYRYLLDGEVVYIGQGNIQRRIADHAREGWEFDEVEYALARDKAECEGFEAECLRAFKDQNGRLPVYNRIMGRKRAA